MATITIRNLNEDLKTQLRIRAAAHGRSMEAEVRAILQETLAKPVTGGLGTRIHQRFAAIGAVELELPDRSESPRFASLPE
jgi:plasmid stability protein